MRTPVVILLIWAAGILSCRGGLVGMKKVSLEWRLETTDTAAVVVVRAGASRQEEVQWLRSIEAIQLSLYGPEGRLLERSELVPMLSGMTTGAGEQVSLLLEGRSTLRSRPNEIPSEVLLEYELRSGARIERGRQRLQRLHRDGALLLMPEVTALDSGLVVRLRVRRLEAIDREYFPTSERLRLELYRGIKRIWSSAEGMAFLQVIGVVEPETVGAESVYEYRWDGHLPTGERLPPGRYSLRLVLPARPHEYSVTVPLEWGPQR
ncbi:MAG: BsuPI-related putative proteinase inhibitor [Candidatus Kapabacteria bacterium]|nr:BsuPI-related putative proteinase inhibitor [Candidatus Kapabacteria bacterium]MDW8012242.1 BsuPI-related putative proteinase inhibitor [Bacteroidota bacterium]